MVRLLTIFHMTINLQDNRIFFRIRRSSDQIAHQTEYVCSIPHSKVIEHENVLHSFFGVSYHDVPISIQYKNESNSYEIELGEISDKYIEHANSVLEYFNRDPVIVKNIAIRDLWEINLLTIKMMNPEFIFYENVDL